MKKVTQVDIARVARVEHSTVSRILNNEPGFSYNKETKQKVFRAAKKLGYLHHSITGPNRRDSERKKYNADVELKVRLLDGSVCAECKAKAVNINSNGMQLELTEQKEGVFPSKPFYLDMAIKDGKKTTNRKGMAIHIIRPGNLRGSRVMRLCRLGLGVQFIDDENED
jgi:transcriptional regulator with XRE-family HTH domain